MPRRIFFIGGVHGVGKSTICQSLCDQFGLVYLSASALIRWSDMNSDSSNKFVNNIAQTQDRLLSALPEFTESDSAYLLDGHYCLLNAGGDVEKIPATVFHGISPSCLCLVTAEPEVIKKRLDARDKREYDINKIALMQETEKAYALELADNMRIPLYTNVANISLGIQNRLATIIP